jgi:hypothetical protein
MEWLLLLLLSSAAAGVVAYFFRDNAQDVSSVSPKEKEQESKKKLIEQENLENLGARSSPQLPEAKQKIRFSVEKSDLEKFKDYIKKVPSPIQPEVIQTDDLKKTLQDVKQDRYRKKKPLKVTYTTDEIIPRMSPFSRHRRPLQNAEKFVEEQKAKEALSIYERLLKRIPDEEIKQKIQKNIDDIKRWLLGLDEDEETIEFPEIIIPLTAQTVAIEKFNEGLKQISEDIAREIAKAFSDGIKDIKATLNVSDAKIEVKEIKAQQFNAEAKEIKSKKFLVGESNIVGSDTGAGSVIEAKEVRAEKLSVGGAGGVGDGAGGGGAGGIGADRVIEAKEVRADKLSVGGAGGVGDGAGGGGAGGIGADRVIEAKEVRADKLSVGGAGGVGDGAGGGGAGGIGADRVIEAKEVRADKLSVGGAGGVGDGAGGGGAGGIGAGRVIEAKEVRADKLSVGGAGGVGDGAGGGGAGGIGAGRVIEAKEVRADKLSVGGAGGVGDGAGGGGAGGIGADRVIEAKEVRADKLSVGGAGGVGDGAGGGGAGGIGADRVIEAKEVRADKLSVGGAGGVGDGAGGGGAGGIGAGRVIEAKEVRADKLSVGGAGGVGDGAGGGGAGGIGAGRVIEAKEVRADKLSVGGAGGVGDGAGGGGAGGIGAGRVIEAKEVRADKLSVGGAGGIRTGKKEETQTSIEKKEIIISRSKEPEELSPKAPHTVYYIVPSFVRKIPKTIQKQKGIPEIEQAEIPLPIGPKVPTRPEEYFQSILTKEGFQFDEEGNLITDGWTDKDFDREWEKYKHLPLIDRRSGLDRRKEFDFDPSRPDRRSGEDRRKINLFEEREKFLEKYLKHLERKEILEKYKDFQNNKELSVYETPETKENIVISIPPSAEELGLEELEEIELPEPISEKFEDLQESIKTIQIDVEPISDEIVKEEKSEVEITPSITSGTLDSEKLEEQEEIELEELNLPEAESQENDMLSLEIPEIEPIEIQETTQEPEKEGIPYSKVEIIEPPINLEELNLPDPEEIIVEELEQKSFPSMPQQEYPQPLQEQQEQTEALQKPEKPEEIIVEELEQKSFPSMPQHEYPQPLQEQQEQTEALQKPEKPEEGMPQPQEPSLEPKQEQLSEGVEELDFPDVPEAPEKKGPVQEIRGVLELKPPDEDDAPFLTLTYDFSKIPDSFQLSKNYHTLEYVYYKYKPLLIKAQEFARRKMLKNALNYYRMIKSQNIPPEFKRMINRNIQDITDYIEKFMMSRTND